MRAKRRSSARWYDSECRSIKRETLRLERLYRRHRSPEARSAWKNQFVLQGRTFQRKFSEFCLNTVESQRTNPRGLWRVVNDILKPPLEVQTKNLSVDSTTSRLTFTTRLKVRRSVGQQQTHLRRPSPLDLLRHVFDPVTEHEVAVLIIKTPAKSCPLDPIPTWLPPRHFSALKFVSAFWFFSVSPKTRIGLPPNQKVITGSPCAQ